MLSLRKAAEETGLTKPAILKSINNGRLSAKKDDKGHWQIDPAELFRVYPARKPENSNQTETGKQELLTENRSLQDKIDKLHQENRELLRDKEQLRADIEEWREQAKATRRLLEDKRNNNSEVEKLKVELKAEKGRGWWSRVLARK